MGSNILLLDNELLDNNEQTSKYIQHELNREGFEVTIQKQLPTLNKYDVVLLNDCDNKILKDIRQKSHIPVIILSSKENLEDKLHMFDLGASDYIIKPFNISELIARVKVFCSFGSSNEKLRVGDMILYPNKYEVQIGDTIIPLAKKEYQLLAFLIKNKNTTLSRMQIFKDVWGYDYMGNSNVVDVYIRFLRAKIDDKLNTNYIRTIRGVGYLLTGE